MEMDENEMLWYLGYGRQSVDEQVSKLMRECWDELSAAASPESISRIYDLRFLEEDGIDASCSQTRSKSLRKSLKDCEKILLFAATLGVPVDMLIQKYNRIQVSKAVVLQAGAMAILEDYCNEENARLKMESKAEGWYLHPRFSPGYGGFPLEYQKELTGALETGKQIGITLTDSLLMTPAKSVTAVIGISRIRRGCIVRGCEVCEKTDCMYRWQNT